MISISVIVVTYNTGIIVLDCIHSLKQSINVDLEIIIVDNNSSDDTREQIIRVHPDVKIIKNALNKGFGHANNVGVKSAKHDLIALINPDLIVMPDTLFQLGKYLITHPKVGLIAPRTFEANGKVSFTARPEYTVWYVITNYLWLGRLNPEWEYGDAYVVNFTAQEPTAVNWVQGSCMTIRRNDYLNIGGFDENYFLYVEDADICQTLREQDFEIIYLPNATATHIGGTSTASFHDIRVRGYHISPLYYFHKRNKASAVQLLKVIFTVELGLKICIRRLRNIIQHNPIQSEQAKAEFKILREIWRY